MSGLPPLVAARNLSYSTPDGRPLAQELSFVVDRGEVLSITGPNGTGKSTLLKVILGELQPSAGSMKLGPCSVGFLSQLHNREFHIPLRLSDVLAFNVRGRFDLQAATRFGLLTESDLALAWNTASGGERQKTLLTQVLLAEPELLILDEPMNHLDTSTRRKLVDVLRGFVADGRRGILMVCHEKTLAAAGWTSTPTLDLSRYAASRC